MAKHRVNDPDTSGSTRRLGFSRSCDMAWRRGGRVSSLSRVFLLLCLSVVFLAAGCGGDTDTGSTDPASDGDPWGLDTIELPAESDAIADVLAAMPDEIDGVPRETTAPDIVTYIEGGDRHLQLGVMDIALHREESGVSEMTVADFLSGMVDRGEMETVESQLDDSRPFVWMAGTTRGDGALLHVASWGLPDGEWIFTAIADNLEARDELVREFVDAVESTD